MVTGKSRKKNVREQGGKHRERDRESGSERVARITADTRYGECSERLTAFGGLLALVKFLDSIGFEEAFEDRYVHPKREPKLGGCRMVAGILMLLFIGFQRLWHFTYVRRDPMLCGIRRVKVLPAVSTFWRYLRSMSIIQSQSLLRLGSVLRERVYEYNECEYLPMGWEEPSRFVAMRIPKEEKGDRQLKLLESEKYVYRVFATDEMMRPHNVIAGYDQRADAENLIGEAQREGVLAIPSKKFQTHHAFFQIVMLAYNLWRWMKLLAGHAQRQEQKGEQVEKRKQITMPDHTIRIARLKMLFVAAKIRFHGNRDEVRYSIHDSRAAGLIDFMVYLDDRRRAEGLAA